MSSVGEFTTTLERKISSGPPAEKPHVKKSEDSSKKQLIIDYFRIGEPCREILCNFWLRGSCIFSDESCRYAHGMKCLEYFIYSELPSDYKFQKPPRTISLRSTLKEVKYLYLLEFQDRLTTLGVIEEKYTLSELNEDGAKRSVIRNNFVNHLTEDFIEMLFDRYKTEYLEREFVEKEIARIGLIAKLPYILERNRFFQSSLVIPPSKSKKDVILKYISTEYYSEKAMDMIAEICLKLNKEPPFSPSEVQQQFYKNTQYTMPSLHILLKKRQERFDDFLIFMEREEKKHPRLTKHLNIVNETLFLTKQGEERVMRQKIIKAEADFWFKKVIGMSKLTTLENYLMNKLPDVLKFFGSETIFKKFARKSMLSNGTYIIFLPSAPLAIAFGYLSKQDNLVINKQVEVKLKKKYLCNVILEEQRLHEYDLIKEQIINEVEKGISEEITNKFAPLKIVVVDDWPSFDYARKLLCDQLYLGVDLEGALWAGKLDLLQIGIMGPNTSDRKIFIFDFLAISKNQEDKLYKAVRNFCKFLLENEEIIKVFQDCRQDVFALHKSLAICPRNIFDLAATHTFHMQLKVYDEYYCQNDEDSNDESEESLEPVRKSEAIVWPGLNVILSYYKASNGENELKTLMKKRFNDDSYREYFQQRPLNQEWLTYSARDVEDLVEVYFRVAEELEKCCGRFSEKITDYVTKVFWRKACRSYQREGCRDKKE